MMLDLAGHWTLSDESGDYCVPITLPGDGITALHAAGAIPDPYWGRNEYGLRWISDRDWLITRQVNVTRCDFDLVLSMLDTVASVWVNGIEVHRSDTMFRSYRIDVSAALRLGENEITLRFHAVAPEAQLRAQTQPYPVPFSTNCPIPHGNLLRKPACDFGWDWNIALGGFGIYGDLRLETIQHARIADVIIAQHHQPDLVQLDLRVEVAGEAEGAPLTLSLCGVQAEAVVKRGVALAKIEIAAPALWWPAGQGAQVLHDLVIEMGDQRVTRRIGLRDAKLVTQKDDAGLGFKFQINGRDIFAKGANWIPADALAGRITQAAVRDLLQSAVDANMNMIRVWGGGRYEPDWFYDLCDELGLMVWHDFMFACHIYPSDQAFLDGVAAEVTEQAKRLNTHASLVLWCGDNELVGALTWFPETRANRDLYLVGYDRLNRTIEQALKAAVPEAAWWPSSPSAGPMDFGDAWHDDSKGDMHFWSVWHEGRDFDHYRDVKPRFCSEFGFQSYPSMDVIRRFAAPEDFNIAAPVMESHQKNVGGNARIAETMFRYFRFPVDFESFVYLSQVQQGLAIKTAVTQWRSLKPHCMGTLIWQLNDTWPVCSWASLDHGGGWKILHHMAKEFYAPVAVSAVPGPEGIALWAINDGATVDVDVAAFAVAMDGSRRALAQARVAVADAAVLALQVGDLGPQEMLGITWTSAGGEGGDIFAPQPYKHYDLLPPKLRHSVQRQGDRYEITVTAQALGLFAVVEADQAGRFDRNAVTVLPDQPVTLVFTPSEAGAAPVFTLRDLHSATYGRPA